MLITKVMETSLRTESLLLAYKYGAVSVEWNCWRVVMMIQSWILFGEE